MRKADCYVCVALLFSGSAFGQWVAFNDHAPGVGTHPNATTFSPGTSGTLKNITNGAAVAASVSITTVSSVAGPIQGVPNYGSPASIVFDGYVNFGGKPNPSIELSASSSASMTIAFSGLDSASEYNFQGTAIRGDYPDVDRWSLYEITGATSFTSKHSAGALTTTQVPAITASQVAINTGFNIQGVLASWEHIRPSSGGFSITCRQYTGTVPGGSSAGSKGYGITGFRLEKAGVYSGRTNLPPRLASAWPATIPGIKTVFLIMMENHDWSTILGDATCPYMNNTLLPTASYCSQYYSPISVHPSEPNYLWLVAGTNFGIRDDNPPANNHQSTANNLFQQLDAAGISWKGYAEDITGTTCPDTDSGEYAVRHVPFVFFDAVRNNSAYCNAHVRPYPEFANDLANNVVPRFNFITPNVTNDMHDLTPGSASTRTQGDTWLSHEVPKILNSRAFTNGGALFITWDEGSNETDGPIGMIAISARAKGGGYHNSLFYTHSSTLRTFQNIFGVRPYLGDAAYATDLSDLFKTMRITSSIFTNSTFHLTVTNVPPGSTNYIQANSDLTSGSWANVASGVAVSNSMTIIAPMSGPQRFYRIAEVP